MRTSSGQLEREAVADLAGVLDAAGYPIELEDTGPADMGVTSPDGSILMVQVFGRAVASTLPESLLDQARRLVKDGTTVFVVGDVVTETAREQLRDVGAGWLDRRGHLRVPLGVEADVAPCPRASLAGGEPDPLGGRAAMEVALASLMSSDRVWGVRELARTVGMAASTISAARSGLERALLLTPDGRPVRPNLFLAVAARWRPNWRPLASDPTGRLDDVERVIGGDVGAVFNGAPMAIGAGAATHYYVRGHREVQRVIGLAGEGSILEPAAWVGVAPSRLVVEAAEPREPSSVPGPAGRVVPSVVSALELATDPARGREILDAWDLEEAPWRP